MDFRRWLTSGLAGTDGEISPDTPRQSTYRHSTANGVEEFWEDDLPCTYEMTVSPGMDMLTINMKECQDEGIIRRRFAGDARQAFVGVFDGHGKHGRQASKWVGERLPAMIAANENLAADPCKAFAEECVAVDALLEVETCGINCEFSGTTAVFALIRDLDVFIGWVGDSRVCVAEDDGQGGLVATSLSEDHKPDDKEETRRIERCGGEVRQSEVMPGDFDGPFRVFIRGRKYPGIAMSRSIGDKVAGSVGVCPDPTCAVYKIKPTDTFLLFASDGLWEVFTCQEAVGWIRDYASKPELMVRLPVSQALAEEAQRRWTQMDDESVVDDTTVLIVNLDASEYQYGIPTRDFPGAPYL